LPFVGIFLCNSDRRPVYYFGYKQPFTEGEMNEKGYHYRKQQWFWSISSRGKPLTKKDQSKTILSMSQGRTPLRNKPKQGDSNEQAV